MFPDSIRNWAANFWQNDNNRRKLQIVFELLLIGIWAMWVGREYLDFDSAVVPAGREFSSAIQTNHLWTRFQECGWCALWNGSGQGGYPAFAEPYGSALHPLVIITTYLWGVINGAKVSLVIGFWVAGIAQWWLARELKLSWLPRLWSAAMAVVGGHLAGRMELGVFGVFLSTSMSSLVFAGFISLAREKSWKRTIVLAIVFSLSLLAGQGYMQIGLLGIIPALFFLIIDGKFRIRSVWKNFALAALIAILLAAPFLLPFAHFSPNFVKHIDPDFTSAQPIAYIPLNLVIDDVDFYRTELLSKLAYPYMNTLYIGWIPVLLALLGIKFVRQDDRKYFWFLGGTIGMELLLSSATILKWIQGIIPEVAGVRYPTIIAGLIVPPILGMAAYGLDHLLAMSWPNLWLGFGEREKQPRKTFNLQWLLLIPLIISLNSGYQFSQIWIFTIRRDKVVEPVIENLHSETLQWVNPPFGEHHYIEPAIAAGLKISPGIMPWGWEDRDRPIPYLEASHSGIPAGTVELVDTVADVSIYAHTDEFYAAVVNAEKIELCHATGNSGRITIRCTVDVSGRLVVKDNTFSGWNAWMDGERVPLVGEQWLEVDAPAGEHTYEFRYQPWDVLLGLALSVLGIVLCVWLWFAAPKESQVIVNSDAVNKLGDLSESEE